MVNRVTTSGVSVRALREFGLALRSGPFRVALVLSLIVHLVLLVVFGWGRLGREGGSDRSIPLMRVRLLLAGDPGCRSRRARNQAGGQATPAGAGRTAGCGGSHRHSPRPPPRHRRPQWSRACARARVCAGAREDRARRSARRQASEETSQAPVTVALSPVLAPGAEQVSLAPAAGVQATGSVISGARRRQRL